MNSNKLYFPILFLAFVAIFQPFICVAQSANVKTMESHAKTLFDKREYEQAFDYYMKLKELRPKKMSLNTVQVFAQFIKEMLLLLWR